MTHWKNQTEAHEQTINSLNAKLTAALKRAKEAEEIVTISQAKQSKLSEQLQCQTLQLQAAEAKTRTVEELHNQEKQRVATSETKLHETEQELKLIQSALHSASTHAGLSTQESHSLKLEATTFRTK